MATKLTPRNKPSQQIIKNLREGSIGIVIVIVNFLVFRRLAIFLNI